MSSTNESSAVEDSLKVDTNSKEETQSFAPYSPRYPGSLPLRPPVDPKLKVREDVTSGVGDVYLRKDGKLVRRVKKRASSTSSVSSASSGVSSYASFDSNDEFSMGTSDIYTRADGKKVRRIKKMKEPVIEIKATVATAAKATVATAAKATADAAAAVATAAAVSTDNAEMIVNSVSPEEPESETVPTITASKFTHIDQPATMIIKHTQIVEPTPSITDEPEPVISFMSSSTDDDEPEPNVDGLDSEPEPVVSYAPTQESEPDLRPIYSTEHYTKLAYSLDPEMNSLDREMNSLDPEMNSLDREMNMTFSAEQDDPVKVKSRLGEPRLKPVESGRLKNPWLVDPSFSEDDENLVKLTMLQILNKGSLESSSMTPLAKSTYDLPPINPFDTIIDKKASLQHVEVSPTMLAVDSENHPGKTKLQRILWQSASGTVLSISPDQSLHQLTLSSPDEIVRDMTDAGDAASLSRTPKGSYKSDKESLSSPTQTSKTKSFESNLDKNLSAPSSSTLESRRTRVCNPLQIALSKSMSYSTNANTMDHYTTDNDTMDLYSTDDRTDSWTQSPESVPQRSLRIPEVLAASTRSRMIEDVSPSNTHTSLFTAYDSSECACYEVVNALFTCNIYNCSNLILSQ